MVAPWVLCFQILSLGTSQQRLVLVNILAASVGTLFDIQVGRSSIRNAASLVIAEHNGEAVAPITYNTIAAAGKMGGDVTALVAGPDCGKVVCEVVGIIN